MNVWLGIRFQVSRLIKWPRTTALRIMKVNREASPLTSPTVSINAAAMVVLGGGGRRCPTYRVRTLA